MVTPRSLEYEIHLIQKFGFIKRVDKGWITTVKGLEIKAEVSSVSPSSERIEELWIIVVYMRV